MVRGVRAWFNGPLEGGCVSIDYWAVPAGDGRGARALLETGQVPEGWPRVDKDGLAMLLVLRIPGLKRERTSDEDEIRLVWRTRLNASKAGGHIDVHLGDHLVKVSHGGLEPDDAVTDLLVALFAVLEDHGLHIYDPQNDQMLADLDASDDDDEIIWN
jgi:hypothetical protein